MSAEHGKVQKRRLGKRSWMWDYFSIKDEGISMAVCEICGKDKTHRKNDSDMRDMMNHLSTKHTNIYISNNKNDRRKILWESLFERVHRSTDNKSVYVKCKHCVTSRDPSCDPYNKRVRIIFSVAMQTHLKEHNVTEDDWNDLQQWRDENTKEYYDLIQDSQESIKRTRLCKKCDPPYQFRHSNLCIMLKHLIQDHRSNFPDSHLPSHILLKELIASNYPADPESNSDQMPSPYGASELMKELEDYMDNYFGRTENVDAASTMNPQPSTSQSNLGEPASKRSKISHNASSDEDD